MKKILSIRGISIIGFLFCIFLMGVAWYLQAYEGLKPCPLCAMQRFFVLLMGVLFFVGALYVPKNFFRRCYYFLCVLISIGGIIVAGRHIWLQHLPADRVPACGADINFILQNLPFIDAMKTIFQGSGECSKVHWHFLGLTIPELTLIAFIMMLALSIWQMVRKESLFS